MSAVPLNILTIRASLMGNPVFIYVSLLPIFNKSRITDFIYVLVFFLKDNKVLIPTPHHLPSLSRSKPNTYGLPPFLCRLPLCILPSPRPSSPLPKKG